MASIGVKNVCCGCDASVVSGRNNQLPERLAD